MDDADNIKPEDRLDQTAEPTGMTAEEMGGDVVNEIDYETLDTNAETSHDCSGISDPADYHETPEFGDPADFLDTAHSPKMYSKADEGSGGAQIANSGANSGRGFQSTENKDVDADRVDETSKQIDCSPSPPTALTGWVPTEAQIRLLGGPAPSIDYELGNDDNTKSASRPRLRMTFGQTCYTEDRSNAEDEPQTSTDSKDIDDNKTSSVLGPRLRLTVGPSCHTEVRRDTEDEFDTEDTIHLGSTDMMGTSPGPAVEEEMWSTEGSMTGSTEAKQCADEKIEELADHSMTGHALDTADLNDTVSNASITAMEHDQDLEVLPQQIRLGSLMLDFWFLLPAFLSLYFMDLPEFLVQWIRASMADLIPKNVQFTLQGFITTSIALMPLWIILIRLVIKTLHKALSPLGMFGYLGLLTMVLHCCNFKVLIAVFLWISNLVRYMVFGNWQMTYQLSSTVLFFSVPFFIVVGQALGIKVTHTIKDSRKTMSQAVHGFITTERRPDQPVLLRTIRSCERCNDHYFEYSFCRIERRKRAMLLTFIYATVLIAAIAIIGMGFHALFKHADKLLSSGLRFKSLFKMIINLTMTLLKFTIDLLAPIDVAIVYFLNDGVRLRCHDLVKEDIPVGLSLDQEKILDAVIWTTIVTLPDDWRESNVRSLH
ncbi:MAG: hypothetical protein L6R42_002632 [Xanthoria sp. 1 TBL-2021]|nr:MAG: hypothetical protein L6R42_002632 [Xanthoria sp. 1 TBL-2021]